MQREAQQVAQRFEAERSELVAQLDAARQQLAAAESAAETGGSPEGGAGREASTQTEEEMRVSSAGHGRRAAAPSRQGTSHFDHQMAASSPIHHRQGTAEGGLPMLHTDNLGQVTPLSSFSPGSAPEEKSGRPSCAEGGVAQRSSPLANGAQRSSSAGRRRGTSLSQGYTAEEAEG